jgi:septal ring factor EnvC (AmiA/AmiB activator)
LNQNKETTSALEKQIKDQQKQMEEMKEQIYEWENKNTELELAMEDYKSAADQ